MLESSDIVKIKAGDSAPRISTRDNIPSHLVLATWQRRSSANALKISVHARDTGDGVSR